MILFYLLSVLSISHLRHILRYFCSFVKKVNGGKRENSEFMLYNEHLNGCIFIKKENAPHGIKCDYAVYEVFYLVFIFLSGHQKWIVSGAAVNELNTAVAFLK